MWCNSSRAVMNDHCGREILLPPRGRLSLPSLKVHECGWSHPTVSESDSFHLISSKGLSWQGLPPEIKESCLSIIYLCFFFSLSYQFRETIRRLRLWFLWRWMPYYKGFQVWPIRIFQTQGNISACIICCKCLGYRCDTTLSIIIQKRW